MESEEAARKLEPLQPETVRRWREARRHGSAEFRERLDAHLAGLAQRELGDCHGPFLSLPGKNLIAGPIRLGMVDYAGERWSAGLRLRELTQHIAIFGRSGAGKTNAAFHLLRQLGGQRIPFLLLDWKRTGRRILPGLKGTALYTPGRAVSPFPFNPFIPPPGIEDRVYINHLIDVMARAYTLGDGSRRVLQQAIDLCYREKGRGPSASSVLAKVEEIPDRERVRGWKISAIRALESIRFAFGDAKEGLSQEELARTFFAHNTIVELDALDEGGKKFLIPLLCFWLYGVRLAEGPVETPALMIVIEEAHQVLRRQEAGSRGSLMEMLLRQCRELGIGFIVIDQHPALISTAVLGNTFASICLNLKDPGDVAKAAALSLLPDTEKGCLGQLPVGQGVVKLQDRWHLPFLVRFPLVSLPPRGLTDSEIGALSPRSGLKAPSVASWAGVRENPALGKFLSADALTFLEDVLAFPEDAVRARYRRLGWSGERGHRTKALLLESGWLEGELVPVGNARKLALRLSRAARKALGVAVEGGFESVAHAYWKRHYARELERQGYRVTVEAPGKDGQGRRVDVLAERDGHRIAVEIETGKSDFLANLRGCLSEGFDHVWIAATSKEALGRIERKVAEAGLLLPGRVRVVAAERATDTIDESQNSS